MAKAKQNMLVYGVAKALAGVISSFVFKRKFIRNEIENAEGPIVLIGNHQAALDFTTLVSATKRPMTFVVSDSFYNTLPFRGLMDKVGVIPKQQFQTSIKAVLTHKTCRINHKNFIFLYCRTHFDNVLDRGLKLLLRNNSHLIH